NWGKTGYTGAVPPHTFKAVKRRASSAVRSGTSIGD
ncbi:hypothetical protein A2U01_0079038, partial [Trifolium medium]|nr:hypothetical protein [Trifolium medium]